MKWKTRAKITSPKESVHKIPKFVVHSLEFSHAFDTNFFCCKLIYCLPVISCDYIPGKLKIASDSREFIASAKQLRSVSYAQISRKAPTIHHVQQILCAFDKTNHIITNKKNNETIRIIKRSKLRPLHTIAWKSFRRNWSFETKRRFCNESESVLEISF